MHMVKKYIGVCLAIGVAFFVAACAPTEGQVTFDLLDDGETTLADYQGQVVILNFWATWCGPCVIEMPMLQDFYEEYGGDELELLAINIGERPEVAREFADEGGFTFPIVLDPNGNLYDHYAVRGQPTTFVLNRQGEVVFQHTGLIVEQQLEEAVLPLLQQEASSN